MDRSERRDKRSWDIKEQRAADRRADRRRRAFPSPPRSPADVFQQWYRATYLNSLHWRFVRQKKLESVAAICARCGHQSWSNDVHHLTYQRLGAERLEDLAVLCRRCHAEAHLEK